MSRQRSRNTQPEVALRRELHRRGRRYRVHIGVVPGLRRKPDLAFTRARVAVFVDGCFWHCCPEHATQPKTNADWWRDKLQGNVRRDRDTDRRLEEAGWHVVRVWEHEDPVSGADRVETALQQVLTVHPAPLAGPVQPPASSSAKKP